jgi:NadR type nicotinamide-nucleotide adenylyltransferase
VAGHQVVDDPFSAWAQLEPIVRAHYAARVRLVGGESTGKTTLADQLARSLQTAWVPEHGRTYSTPLDRREHTWTTADFMVIARRQAELEDLAAWRADRVLLCGTDAMVTAMWHEQYLGHRADELEAYADARRHYPLTLVADTDIPWIQDGDRRSVAARRAQQADLLERLARRGE